MAITLDGTAGINASGSLTTSSSLTTGTGAVYNSIQSSTAVASTSGTSIDFTSIPSWVKKITVMFNGVSTNSTSFKQIQLGTSSAIDVTGYLGCMANTSSTAVSTTLITTGFGIRSNAAADLLNGAVTINNLTGNTWVVYGVMSASNAAESYIISGSKALSGTLTQVRITTVNGTDTFDAGSINILYE